MIIVVEDEKDLQIGYIANYDIVTANGVIIDPEGASYTFSGQDIIGTFPVLMEKPWVRFNISGHQATEIMYEPSITERQQPVRRGMAVFGAAKCPNCDWRIPAIPSTNQALLRRKGFWAMCPECGVKLFLKSKVKGMHHYLVVLIWILIIAGIRVLLVESAYLPEEFQPYRLSLGFLFFFIMFSSLLYIHIQETLIQIDIEGDA